MTFYYLLTKLILNIIDNARCATTGGTGERTCRLTVS